MKCTVDWMKKRYDYWNKKAFDGTLPDSSEIEFYVYDSIEDAPLPCLGLFQWTSDAIDAWWNYDHYPFYYQHHIDEWKKDPYKVKDMKIHMFNKYDGPQRFFDQTLLHEMCHVKDMMLNGDHGYILFDEKENRFVKNPEWNCSRDTHSDTFYEIVLEVYNRTKIAPIVKYYKGKKKIADDDWTIMRGNGRYLYKDLFEFYKGYKKPQIGDY